MIHLPHLHSLSTTTSTKNLFYPLVDEGSRSSEVPKFNVNVDLIMIIESMLKSLRGLTQTFETVKSKLLGKTNVTEGRSISFPIESNLFNRNNTQIFNTNCNPAMLTPLELKKQLEEAFEAFMLDYQRWYVKYPVHERVIPNYENELNDGGLEMGFPNVTQGQAQEQSISGSLELKEELTVIGKENSFLSKDGMDIIPLLNKKGVILESNWVNKEKHKPNAQKRFIRSLSLSHQSRMSNENQCKTYRRKKDRNRSLSIRSEGIYVSVRDIDEKGYGNSFTKELGTIRLKQLTDDANSSWIRRNLSNENSMRNKDRDKDISTDFSMEIQDIDMQQIQYDGDGLNVNERILMELEGDDGN